MNELVTLLQCTELREPTEACVYCGALSWDPQSAVLTFMLKTVTSLDQHWLQAASAALLFHHTRGHMQYVQVASLLQHVVNSEKISISVLYYFPSKYVKPGI